VPYTITEAADPLNIREAEFASATEIKFTTFTSCIGVIAKKGATLTAVHLVMLDKHDIKFTATDVSTVVDVLPGAPDAVTIMGCIDLWANSVNGMSAAFEKLTGTFKTLKKDQREDGIYGAKIDGNTIKITKR